MIIQSKGEIAESLYAIGTPLFPAFLLMADQPVLFDAGLFAQGPLYLEELKALLGDENRLLFNFLTHSHFDHCGGSFYLKSKIAQLEIGAHSIAADILKKPSAVALIKNLNQEYDRELCHEDVSFNNLNVDIVFEDGMEFDLGRGLGFKVIATPGHTRDSISFFIPKYKALIPGEAVGVFDMNMTIHPDFPSSYNDYFSSLEKLASLDLEILMMSHSFTLTGDDAKDYIAKSIKETLRFKKRIEQYLHECNGNTEAVVQRIFEEDYKATGAILQGERAYLLNLTAMVKSLAELK